MRVQSLPDLPGEIARILNISLELGAAIVAEGQRLYIDKMRERFSGLRMRDRLKRTNPFLLRIRGAATVSDWARLQVQSTLYASEEEAVGHLLESIAKHCHPGAAAPLYPDDFDYEVCSGSLVEGYQVKMSWDCMPMSSRKNLSNTIRQLETRYAAEGKTFVGHFAPCYGKSTTSKPPGQAYVSLGSREFWTRVGNGDAGYDVKVGEVCALLCSEFRREISATLLPELEKELAQAAQPLIGGPGGVLDYERLHRAVNK